MRSLEIPTQRIFNNLIEQNQKLAYYFVLNGQRQCPVPRAQRSKCSIQRPASNVHRPASGVQRTEFSVQSPESNVQSSASRVQCLESGLQSPGIPVYLKSYVFRLLNTYTLVSLIFNPFSAWYPLKGQTYLNKPAAFSFQLSHLFKFV